jgi:hypothetical protein
VRRPRRQRTTSIQLYDPEYEALKAIAAVHQVSMGSVIRAAVRRFLKDWRERTPSDALGLLSPAEKAS